MHGLNYSGQESKEQFAVHDSDIPVALKGYNHAKFERPLLNSLPKSHVQVFFQIRKHVNYFP